MLSALDAQLPTMAKALVDGRAVPFLGAGVNLCDRPRDVAWQKVQRAYLPSGSELAAYLADNRFVCRDAVVITLSLIKAKLLEDRLACGTQHK